MQRGTTFTAVLFKNDVTDWPTSFFYREKWSTLFCCRGRIEIKSLYLFSWLLQNNLLGVEMLFEIQKPRLTPRLYYFISPPRRLFVLCDTWQEIADFGVSSEGDPHLSVFCNKLLKIYLFRIPKVTSIIFVKSSLSRTHSVQGIFLWKGISVFKKNKNQTNNKNKPENARVPIKRENFNSLFNNVIENLLMNLSPNFKQTLRRTVQIEALDKV